MDRLQIEEYAHEYEDNIPADTVKFYPFEYLPLFNFEQSCPVNHLYRVKDFPQFSNDCKELYLGYSITYMHLQIASIMGCNPIILIGADHRYNLKPNPKSEEKQPKKPLRGNQRTDLWTTANTKADTHFDKRYTKNKRFVPPRPEMMEKAFACATQWAEENGVEILNATPGTALKTFPSVTYENLFVQEGNRAYFVNPGCESSGRNKTLVMTNGNDAQVPFIIRLFQRLYDPEFGNYEGDFLAVSDHFSAEAAALLTEWKIPVYLFDSPQVTEWEQTLSSDKHALGKLGKPFFIKEIIRQFGDQYDNLVYLDPDILIQEPLQLILDKITDTYVLMSREQVLIPQHRTGWPSLQLQRSINFGDVDESILISNEFEINTGFLAGRIELINNLVSQLIDFMTTEPFKKYAISDPGKNNAWHDQDYFRCFVRLQDNPPLILLGENDIVHLCGGSHKGVTLKPELASKLQLKVTEVTPKLVHFAGGSVKYFKTYQEYYDVNRIERSLGLSTPVSNQQVGTIFKTVLNDSFPQSASTTPPSRLKSIYHILIPLKARLSLRKWRLQTISGTRSLYHYFVRDEARLRLRRIRVRLLGR